MKTRQKDAIRTIVSAGFLSALLQVLAGSVDNRPDFRPVTDRRR